MVTITLFGEIGKAVGKKEWILDVKSCSEAIRAIDVLTDNKLSRYFYKHGYDGFNVLIDNELYKRPEEWDAKDENVINKIRDSELCLKRPSIKTIDIVPVVAGGDSDVFGIILGVLLIVVGVVLIATGVGGPLGAALVIGGIGIVAAGVINLLSKPPTFDDFKEIQQGGGASYLFNGPQNTIREGGPVPVAYGRLIVGSQVISASYDISNIAITQNVATPKPPAGLLLAVNLGGLSYGYFEAGSSSYISPVAGVTTEESFYDDPDDAITVAGLGSGPATIYNSLIFKGPAGAAMTVTIDIPSFANKTVQFKLHWAELYVAGRTFTVTVTNQAGTPVDLFSTGTNTSFNIYGLAGNAMATSWVKKGTTTFDATGKISIVIDASVSTPFLSAIELYDVYGTDGKTPIIIQGS